MARIKNVMSTILFLSLLLIAIVKCADVLEYKEAKKKYTPFYESETNFDVIFLGTSHVWNHVLPMEMWKTEGISSYNWGYANCTPAENYYLIQDILHYTSPKVVVMDVYGLTEYDRYDNGKYRTDRIEQQHVQFDSLPIWSKSKFEASRDVFDNYNFKEDFIWNFIMYHNRWSELSKVDFVYDINPEKGAYFLTGLGIASYNPISNNEKTEIHSVCYPYYLDIIEYCQERGIQVLCVYIPFAANVEQQKIANSIGDIVKGYPNCEYINMLNLGILNFRTDISSEKEQHLNYSGALKVTTWLGEYLRNNYDLDNYSCDYSWKNDYKKYYEYKKERIKGLTTLPDYLVQLIDTDFTAQLFFYNQKMYDSERLMLLCDNASIEPVFKEIESDCCAKLIIKSSITGELVEVLEFSCNNDNMEDIDIFAIVKDLKEVIN